MARPQKTSFNICPVSVAKYGSAYQHQKPEHRATLNYIHSERTNLNQSWHKEYQANGHPKTLRNYLADTKKVVKAKTGRAMQKRAEEKVIGEAVVVIDDETSMDDLKKLGKEMEERFGWTCVQIHIHKDEGYLGERTEEMKHREGKYNLHAHMFFVTTNLTTGKSWKMQVGDGSAMQDITAKALDLTRGERKGSKKSKAIDTLNVVEYKQVQALKSIDELKTEERQTLANLEDARLKLDKTQTATQARIEQAKKVRDGVGAKFTNYVMQYSEGARQNLARLEWFKQHRSEIERGEKVITLMRDYRDKEGETQEEFKQRHTKKNLLGYEVTDWKGMYNELRELYHHREAEHKRSLDEKEVRHDIDRNRADEAEDKFATLCKTIGRGFMTLLNDCLEYFRDNAKAIKTSWYLIQGGSVTNGKDDEEAEVYSKDQESHLEVNGEPFRRWRDILLPQIKERKIERLRRKYEQEYERGVSRPQTRTIRQSETEQQQPNKSRGMRR